MKKSGSKITDLLALLVFALFALCLLRVLLTGASVYQRLSQGGQDRFADQTAVQYLSARVRQGNGLTVEPFGDGDALVFRQEFEGTAFLTRVYCYDGYLWELFSLAEGELEPRDGEKILPLETLKLTLADGLLTVDTGDRQILLALRQGREVLP